MREAWTDERLDDLNRKVENGFNRVDADIRELRGEMNSRFDTIDRRFESIDKRFDAMQRLMTQVGGGMIAALVAALMGLIATHV